ncbi:MAG: signal peptidase I [Hyphomicrobium denitrificans]|uniref:Signal peptidase I n=1 Tax=Hyphomicrobium denitrificans (strain ATCC 51888 / DSM 1869 / NCIMB 11706 / TK 0415) TaxID=582899 RepID=D8JR55_HYPDA|nr:signal peptidase I [Hyphomicrobium denitrificans]ADJ24040.1 signal peptidase I [Hyphomicrobium denitrificans ATCC 51888]MBN9292031.1 signal peptidase I [Hyphomicrobium denitrificans]
MSIGTKTSGSSWSETLIIVVEALAIAMLVRIFFYQPFNIPSGSMKETLLVGDYLFVSKLSYGYSKFSFPFSPDLFSGRIWGAEPKRGDVAVFKLPRDNSTDYIKRVIGLPGDEIQMKGGQLFINGQAVPKVPAGSFTTREEGRERAIPVFQETLPNGVKYNVLDSDPDGPYDNTAVYKVPPGHYFMMGDNRDNSTDSRVQSSRYGVGFVPYENFIGRAEIIFFSADVDEPDAFRWWSPWTWPFDIRWNRFFHLVR